LLTLQICFELVELDPGVPASTGFLQEDVLGDWRSCSSASRLDSNSLGVYVHIPGPIDFAPHGSILFSLPEPG
jgi:hypothetical protein